MVPKILVVEDDKYFSELFRTNLEEKGYAVIVANTGKEAVTLADDNKPDLILLDLVLETNDGFDALRTIKSDPITKNIQLIVISNMERPEEIKRAKELGADNYLVRVETGIEDVLEQVSKMLPVKIN